MVTVLPNHRKTGCGDLWRDCCEFGGGVGMFSGDKMRSIGRVLCLVVRRRAVARTLLGVCMST